MCFSWRNDVHAPTLKLSWTRAGIIKVETGVKHEKQANINDKENNQNIPSFLDYKYPFLSPNKSDVTTLHI